MDVLNFRLQAEEYEKILFILASLQRKLNANAVFLISRSGQEIASHGAAGEWDRQALSSLAASNLAATFGLAKLFGETEFERIYHKGENNSILINPAGDNALLLFLFGQVKRHSLDLKSIRQATIIVADVLERSNSRG